MERTPIRCTRNFVTTFRVHSKDSLTVTTPRTRIRVVLAPGTFSSHVEAQSVGAPVSNIRLLYLRPKPNSWPRLTPDAKTFGYVDFWASSLTYRRHSHQRPARTKRFRSSEDATEVLRQRSSNHVPRGQLGMPEMLRRSSP